MTMENNYRIVSCLFKVGDKIHIDTMKDEPPYTDKEGEVVYIDSLGQLHGTWGGCALIYGVDEFHKI